MGWCNGQAGGCNEQAGGCNEQAGGCNEQAIFTLAECHRYWTNGDD